MTDEEKKEWDLKLRKLDAEIGHLQAMTAKALQSDTEAAKAQAGLHRRQTMTDGWKTGAAIALAAVAVVKLIELL